MLFIPTPDEITFWTISNSVNHQMFLKLIEVNLSNLCSQINFHSTRMVRILTNDNIKQIRLSIFLPFESTILPTIITPTPRKQSGYFKNNKQRCSISKS